jgi:hypothetical protein
VSEPANNVVEIRPGDRLDKKGFARRLACSVSYVEKRMQEGMPCEKLGTRIKFEPLESEEWLRDHGFMMKRKGEAA